MTEVISGRSRPPYVPYPRWYALILQYFGTGYVGEPEDDFPIVFSSYKLFSTEPTADDPHITKGMGKWITNPYEAERRAYVPTSPPAETQSAATADDYSDAASLFSRAHSSASASSSYH